MGRKAADQGAHGAQALKTVYGQKRNSVLSAKTVKLLKELQEEKLSLDQQKQEDLSKLAAERLLKEEEAKEKFEKEKHRLWDAHKAGTLKPIDYCRLRGDRGCSCSLPRWRVSRLTDALNDTLEKIKNVEEDAVRQFVANYDKETTRLNRLWHNEWRRVSPGSPCPAYESIDRHAEILEEN